MIEYFNSNLYAFWFAVGFILLGIELLAFGLATGVILFIGLAALATGGLLWFSIIPLSWASSIATFSFCSIALSVLLWKPLKKLQNTETALQKDNSSDLIGYEFRLADNISLSQPSVTRYSGIEWKVELDDSADITTIKAGSKVRVTSVDAGKFRVAPAE